MKKLLVALTVVGVLVIGAGAFAFGPGWFGGGHMMGGTGYGGMMMGPGMMGGYGMGPGMMGWSGTNRGYGYDQKFLDETRDLRKELHEKRFEYFEALRNPETTPETVTKLEKEITELQQKLHEKAPRTAFRGGFGTTGTPCWQ